MTKLEENENEKRDVEFYLKLFKIRMLVGVLRINAVKKLSKEKLANEVKNEPGKVIFEFSLESNVIESINTLLRNLGLTEASTIEIEDAAEMLFKKRIKFSNNSFTIQIDDIATLHRNSKYITLSAIETRVFEGK